MLFADSPEACPYGFHRFVIFDQTDKLQFEFTPKSYIYFENFSKYFPTYIQIPANVV